MKKIILLLLVAGCIKQPIVQAPDELYIEPIKRAAPIVVEDVPTPSIKWEVVPTQPWVNSNHFYNRIEYDYIYDDGSGKTTTVKAVAYNQGELLKVTCSEGINSLLSCPEIKGKIDIFCSQMQLGVFCEVEGKE